jgi:DNA polymerase III epsilon subunit family exonuclease
MSFEPTAQQRKAIEAPRGPVLVIAGPGAGKTFCLIYRIQHLIQKLDIVPRRILAVTFTNKAAQEIASRLHETRGVTAAEVTRGTLHATCLMILRDFAERCGLRQGFGVADREYQEQVLRRLRIPAKRCSQALSLFSQYRLQGKPLGERGMMFFGKYQDALRARNLADFDDLITLTERLLRTDAEAAAQLRSRWDYVLVDEFQDLNPTQYGIVRRIAETHRGLFGVGDDEQSIFSWTGADPEIIRQFRDDFSLREPIVLDENRRCSVKILDSARRLIACNPVLFEKQIDTTLESPFEVMACGFDNEEDEATWLMSDIMRDRAAEQTGWGDYALLYRYRWMGRDLEQRLISAGIPCRMARGQALADDKVVGWVIASLRVIRSPDDPVLLGALANLALTPALRQEIRKESSKDKDFLANLRAFASRRSKGDADRKRVWRLIYHLENLRGLGRSHHALSGLVDELLARPIGAGRNPLEEYHHDLIDPAVYPGAGVLAKRLQECMASGARVLVEPGGGLEIPILAMLRGGGISNAHRLTSDRTPAPEDFVIRRSADGLPLRLFKALQLIQTEELKTDFDDFVAFDVETSDFDFEHCEIIEIAAVRVRGKAVVGYFNTLVSCTRPISSEATEVHGYRDEDLVGAPSMADVWRRFREFVGDDLVVAHNGQEFDVPVLRRACGAFEGFEELVFYDTLPLARAVVDGSVKLTFLAQKFNVEVGRAHHAYDDALMLAGVVPALSELRLRRARKIALVHLLDQLGLALALDQDSSASREDILFREITRPYTLGRYSDCLEIYAAQYGDAHGAPDLDEVIVRLGGHALMERLRAERTVDERYPGSIERLRMLVQSSGGTTVAEHIDNMLWRVALSTSAEAETDPNRVNLLTLHSTKGLEFSRVYVIGVENHVLPGWRAIQEDRTEEIQEGRRLLYVGMTRAKHRLVLTHSERRGGFDAQGNLFLTEAGLVLDYPGTPPALGVPAISE